MITTRVHTVLGLVASLVGGCAFSSHSESATTTQPTVVAHTPASGAIEVALDSHITATFSEDMDPASLTTATFAVTTGVPPIALAGTVSYADATAVFEPTERLASNGTYTATITTDATSATGDGLVGDEVWSFTGDSIAGTPVPLGTAGTYAILAQAGISGTGATVIGDLGVSPAAATYITGFSLVADAGNMFSTSAQLVGKAFAASYVAPTPANLTLAVADLEVAVTAAAARTPDVVELGGGAAGGLTLAPGVYRWSTGLGIATDVTLSGSAKEVWIFQIAGDLTFGAGAHVVLTGGALASNVFWQVTGGPLTLGPAAHLEGIVLTRTAVTFAAGASVHGRLLAQTAVIVDGGSVVADGDANAM